MNALYLAFTRGWMVRIHRVTEQNEEKNKEFHMPVFVYVFTKFRKMPNMPSVSCT